MIKFPRASINSFDEYKPELDGLRAIAVVAVLLFHFQISMPGGFIGVDIFFVISGFLITNITLRQIRRQNFSILSFYLRRVTRLYPSLIVTVLVTLVVGFLIMDSTAFKSLSISAQHTLLSISNYYFWGNQGYFEPTAETNPFLHSWSLSTEWQFYLLWPVLLVVCAKVSELFLKVMVVALAVTSLLASHHVLQVDASASYYLMPYRFFQIATGALLLFVYHFRLNPFYENLIFCGGVMILLSTAMLINHSVPYPGFLGLLPCIGAAMVIYGGRSSAGNLLRLKPLTYIGIISYSIYLVHWPLLVLYKYYFFTEIDLTISVSLMIASIVLGALLYHIVEKRALLAGGKSLPLTCGAFMFCCVFANSVALHGGWEWRVPDDYKAFSGNAAEFHKKNYGGYGFNLDSILGSSDGTPVAVLGGDSFAHQYAKGMNDLLKERDESVIGHFRHGCVISGYYTRLLNNAPLEACRETYRKILSDLRGNNLPLIYALSWEGYRNKIVDVNGDQVASSSMSDYKDVIFDMLSRIRQDIGHRSLIIVGSQPYIGEQQTWPLAC